MGPADRAPAGCLPSGAPIRTGAHHPTPVRGGWSRCRPDRPVIRLL